MSTTSTNTYPSTTLTAETIDAATIASDANKLLTSQGVSTTASGRASDASTAAQAAADASNKSWEKSMSDIYGDWKTELASQSSDASSLRSLGTTLMGGNLPQAVLDQLVKQQSSLNLSSGVYGGAANSATLSSLGINVLNSMVTGAGLVEKASTLSSNIISEATALQKTKAQASDFYSTILNASTSLATQALTTASSTAEYNATAKATTALSNLNASIDKWKTQTSLDLWNLTRSDTLAASAKNTSNASGSSSTSTKKKGSTYLWMPGESNYSYADAQAALAT